MMLFSIGIGLILSAFFMFFRDIEYLWRVFLLLLMYGSAIFYPIDGFSQKMQLMFACNPVYRHIAYFREIVLKGSIPSVETHLVLAGVAVLAVLIGALIYKNNNTKFLYYV
jgi:ABC-2 type transport system permease protein